jgi:hypothetical protein
MGVIEAPWVQLKNGLCSTIEITDLSADGRSRISVPQKRESFI